MCLLHTHHADTKLSDAWIADFYDFNSDGIGVMYSEPDENGKPCLVVKKGLPRNEDDAIKFYNENILGRECVVHWRMATHGDIDFDNCHPYEVLPMDSAHPMYMMHNGVLNCGNFKDRSKSDTWHYVNDYLKPLLDPARGGNPQLAFMEPFIEILGDSIGGSNKFAFMDYAGNISIINRIDGVEWNGMWLSNTYAWSVPNHVMARNRKWENKYYGAAQQVTTTSAPIPSNPQFDYLDEPVLAKWWDNHHVAAKGNVTGVAAKHGTVTPIGGKKKNKKQKRTALVPPASTKGTGTVTVNHAGEVTGYKEVAQADAELILQEKEVTDMFDLLDDESKHKAYVSLSYQNFYKFIDATDLDACWEAVYMVVDNVLDEDTFIDYILEPHKWTEQRPRVSGRTNIAGGEVDPETVWDDEDDVIEATLPEPSKDTVDQINREAQARFEHVLRTPSELGPITPASTGTQIMPRPVIDQRANANIFDRAGGQSV